MAKAAGVNRLDAFQDLSFLDLYAHRYGMNPTQVYHESFDDVFAMFALWKERDEFHDRLMKVKKSQPQPNATTKS
jgi:hypothetical protein